MITADLIIEDLQAASKKQVFESIAAQSAELFFGQPDAVLRALLERERLGSTGIGCGVAIPHVKLAGLKRMYGVLARLSHAVDYDAIDGRPVDIVFMLLAPEGAKTTLHLKALAQVSRFLKDAEVCNRIRMSCAQEAITAVFTDWLNRQVA
jgi:PTS system nitrogen regulatory IIA component